METKNRTKIENRSITSRGSEGLRASESELTPRASVASNLPEGHWRSRLLAVLAIVFATSVVSLPALGKKISAPKWLIKPRNIGFGFVPSGSIPIIKHLTIQNTDSSNPLNFSVGEITGRDAAAFTLSPTPGVFNISPGASATFKVKFTPRKGGVSRAILPLSSGGHIANVILRGRAKGAIPTPTPTPTATPTPAVSTTSTGIGVVATSDSATAYIARGSYQPGSEKGIDVVSLEPIHASKSAAPVNALIQTATPAIACSGDSATGEVVCVGANNEVFTINNNTLTQTLTSAGVGHADFSGGSCTSCGVTVDQTTNSAVISLNLSSNPSAPLGGYQVLDLGTKTFGPTFPNGEEQPSESPALDTVNHLILSPGPSQPGDVDAFAPDYALVALNPDINTSATAQAFDFIEAPAVFGSAADLDAAGIDPGNRVIIATEELAVPGLFMANMAQASFASSAPFTWDAPNQVQSLPEFASFMYSGLAAIAVAPVGHTVLAEDEFGQGSFGVIQLQSMVTNGPPVATDWVVATLPTPPGSGILWAMTGDPHGIGAYSSTISNKDWGLLVNDQRTFLAVIDMAALLGASRSTPGGHVISPGVDLVKSGIVTFIALP
jgi:hypothetical protein